MPGALEGLRVIDFGQYVAGPMAAMLLGDQGAEVIRVDPPGGPVFDGPANAMWNRNKRSIVLDLKTSDGLQSAKQLIASADVVIENFRPGVMDRLGLGVEAMTAANPRLVYCSLPGFASDDSRAGIRAWEGTVAAATATYPPNPRTGRPIYTPLPFSSSYAAFQAAVSITMALNARERDGVGQAIEVPLFDGTFAAIGYRGQFVHNGAGGVDLAAMARLLGWTRQFLCKDGRWFMYHAGNQNAEAFLEASGWKGVAPSADADPKEQAAAIEAHFLTRTAAEWEAFCEQVGTEGAICRTTAEWLATEHAIEGGTVADLEDPQLGKLRGVGLNVRMSLTPPAIRSPRPIPDADRESILASLQALAAPAPAPAVSALRPVLEGVRVLDLCIILAGPTCGRTLAEFGADVIKIDSPHRPAVIFHTDINRAKRSILLDLKTPEGLEIFWKLVDSADVVVQNFRKGVAEKLGIGYEDVKRRKPGIVYASLNTYGRVGRFADRPGHEQIAQAASGMQERFGGDGKPTLAPFAVNDYGTGFMGAFGVAMALLHKKKTGQGQHVDTGLAYTATMLQSLYLQDYSGKTWDEPRGQDIVGSSPLNRAYETTDGWVFLAARPGELAAAPSFASLASLEGAELEAALEAAFRSRDIASAVAELNAAGIGAQPCLKDVRQLMENPWVQAHGLSITRDHDGLGPTTTIGPSARLARTPMTPGRPAPIPGSDAASILSEIGLRADMDRLVQQKIVVTEGVLAR